jgi:hypothetical protein
MIEVDIFWSFGIGSMIAAAASVHLASESSPLVNKYFIYNLLVLSCIFAPSGVYLLWGFPGWETMFVFDRNLHAIFPCLFAFTNVFNGVAGFLATYYAIKSKRDWMMMALVSWPYVCMFGILGLGYARFLYPGTIEEWRRGVQYPYLSWFRSEVFFTLIVMGFFLLPPLWYPIFAWSSQHFERKSRLVKYFLQSWMLGVGVWAFGYLIYVHGFANEVEKKRLSEGVYGYYAPLVGMLVSEVAFTLFGFWPLLVAPATKLKQK